MERPDYTFYQTPTTEELRKRAMQALRDFLSVQWRTHKKIAHSKNGAVSHKRFIYEADNTYAGVPYTDAGKGLFQFLEFYDEQTGRLQFYGDGAAFNENIGGTCACGVCWSLSTVSHSLYGCFINFWMTPKNGYIPVGGYKAPTDVEDYRNYHTSRIIEDNGEETMLECYTKIQPADAVCSSTRDHTMMCIDYPHVERDENGKIDRENSYVIISDQCGGSGVGFYDHRVEDDLIHYSGRTEQKFTFAALLKACYIPVTIPEFTGAEPYERANIRFSGDACTSKEDLLKGSVLCNYPMAVIKLMLTKANGHRVMIDRYMVNRRDPHNGLARCFPMERMAEAIQNAQGQKLEVEVTASNGEIVIPVSFAL